MLTHKRGCDLQPIPFFFVPVFFSRADLILFRREAEKCLPQLSIVRARDILPRDLRSSGPSLRIYSDDDAMLLKMLSRAPINNDHEAPPHWSVLRYSITGAV